MERSEILTAMGELKLYGMKAAYRRDHQPPRSSASTSRSASLATC